MLKAALAVTLRILLFRAGPEDFPYSEQPRLLYSCMVLAVLASGLLFGALMTPLAALATGAFATAALSMFTRMLLRLRKLDNRHAQSLGALLCCGSLLMLVMRLLINETIPEMRDFYDHLLKDPAFGDDVANWPKVQGITSYALNFLMLWLFAVTAHIYRRATGTGFLLSGGLAALAMMNVLMFLLFTSPLLGALAN